MWRWFESIPTDQKFLANETPKFLAEFFVESLVIEKDDRVLEPSAGSGIIVEEILKYTANIVAVELNSNLFDQLKSTMKIKKDFLKITPEQIGLFTHIIMCPPKQSDLHIAHAIKFLQPGGKLIALVQTQNVDYFKNDLDILPDIFVYSDKSVECGIVYYEN